MVDELPPLTREAGRNKSKQKTSEMEGGLQFFCEICPDKVFSTGQQLGGHNSSVHKGCSQKNALRIEARSRRTAQRHSRKLTKRLFREHFDTEGMKPSDLSRKQTLICKMILELRGAEFEDLDEKSDKEFSEEWLATLVYDLKHSKKRQSKTVRKLLDQFTKCERDSFSKTQAVRSAPATSLAND